MNFDLKTLALPAAAAEKCDLLVLLVPDGFKPSDDVLSVLVAQAIKHGDFKTTLFQQHSKGSGRDAFA